MRVLTKRVGGVLAAIALILGLGAVAPTTALAEVSPSGPGGAMPMSETEFVAAAVEVAGLTASEARAAYADPEVAATVPVEVVTDAGATGGPIAESGFRASEAEADEFWCDAWMYYRINNALGVELYRYRMDKHFETDETVITAWDVTESGPVTFAGEVAGWYYNGTIESNDADRESGSVHYSQRIGQFKAAAVPPFPEETDSIELQMIVHANLDYEMTFPDGSEILGACTLA